MRGYSRMPTQKLNSKKRRHSGRIYPKLAIRESRKFILNECLEPQIYWDDWRDHRDGMRNNSDNSMVRPGPCCCIDDEERSKYNKKLKKLTKRRKAMKYGRPIL